MRKKLKALISLLTMAALMLPMAVMPVFAEGEETSDKYTAPETLSVTYNMNLDWKFFDTHNLKDDIFTAMSIADKNGKKFYEKDYDDSAWESVSIPHAPGSGKNAFASSIGDSGGGLYDTVLYRKTFTVPNVTNGTKFFFELEGIRQAAYVWVNGQPVGYYEAGIAPMGFDITKFVTPGQTAVIAICNDGSGTKGNSNKCMHETVPGETWGSSYTPNNGTTNYGAGVGYSWNTKDFNEPQIGLVYDAYLHVKGSVYQTLPLYNNLKTTGNYIYATDFDTKQNKATIHVDAEVRNESAADGNYTLQVDVVDHTGKLAYTFKSAATEVKKATDKDVVYETAVEDDVYSETNIAKPNGITKVNSPDVTSIKASFEADDVRFWSIDDPYLYTVYTTLLDSTGKAVDVQENKTGFRKITYDANNGIMLNDKQVWLKGYAQRSTNEWAVIGIAPDWLQDYDMALLKSNNSNFIRWMHVAPKPAEVRSSDKYGVAVVCPAGDKEGTGLSGRQWSQRVEAMRDVMIYFRNSPSVFFYETGNSSIGGEANANEMAEMREMVDPYGMRFIGARSTKNVPTELDYDYNYAGTMYGNYAGDATTAMKTNGKMGPIMETEYARGESPRRVWDRYSPPDYDYINKHLNKTDAKKDAYDTHNFTQEELIVSNVREYSENYYQKRMGSSTPVFSAEAMMVWSDSNMHTRNSFSENDRTSGRVDAVRQTKEMYEGTRAAQAETPTVHIVGHWSYPEVSADTYNYLDSDYSETVSTNKGDTPVKVYKDASVASNWLKRDPTKKIVYAIGSVDVKKIELYRVDNGAETKIGEDDEPEQLFIYQFDNVDVTQGDAVIAKAYNARGDQIATDEIKRTGDAASVKLVPHTAPGGWKADGADIAYFDVQVLDKNGNICALNYDKIEFTNISGEGVFLGGYNSGTGTGQQLHSKYFGGTDKAKSTIGENYVWAENGTNRIFVRSTRTAGTFKISVKMEGMLAKEFTLDSVAVESSGGLTSEMQSTLDPGVSTERPVVRTVNPMIPLMKTAWTVDWTKAITETVVDTTVYYDIQYNGANVTVANKAYEELNQNVYGPLLCILDKLQTDGALTYTYENKVLSFSAGGHNYTINAGSNQMSVDGELTEIVMTASEVGDELFAIYEVVLGSTVPNLKIDIDSTNHIIKFTYPASN